MITSCKRCLSGKLLGNGVQCRFGTCAIRATCLSHIRPPAAALAAKRRCTGLDEINCAIFRCEIVGDTNHNTSLAFVCHADDGNDPGFDLAFAIIDKATEDPSAEFRARYARTLSPRPPCAVGVLGWPGHRYLRQVRVFFFGFGELTLEPFALLQETCGPRRHFRRLRPQDIGGLARASHLGQ